MSLIPRRRTAGEKSPSLLSRGFAARMSETLPAVASRYSSAGHSVPRLGTRAAPFGRAPRYSSAVRFT
ncbi:hypothetical protein QA599_15840, partial [Haloarculaceae archaeon H-GB1-1]|nr:hypothetical protein [Haloarculaceae archaeon H-GB1-1]